jgi:hypothetical protein
MSTRSSSPATTAAALGDPPHRAERIGGYQANSR